MLISIKRNYENDFCMRKSTRRRSSKDAPKENVSREWRGYYGGRHRVWGIHKGQAAVFIGSYIAWLQDQI